MKTFSKKPADVKRDWYIVDATEAPLGRLSTKVANVFSKNDDIWVVLERKRECGIERFNHVHVRHDITSLTPLAVPGCAKELFRTLL